MPHSRRHFINTAACALLAAPLGLSFARDNAKPARPHISIFSKHLQFLGYGEMAAKAAEIGFDGVDLTVRPNGHVAPEKVEQDLPRACEAIRDAGLEVPMVTTTVDDPLAPLDRRVLQEASKLGVKRYRMNWLPYKDEQPLPTTIKEYQERIQALSALNRELGLIGCYQNHAGLLVGASLWEAWQLLQAADQSHMGVQYDIRHATVEGGLSWPNGLRLVLPHIKTIVIKDFKWELKDGRATVVDTPVGEGMVDFTRYFRILKDNRIDVPWSLHLEYDLGGAQWGKTEITGSPERVYEAMRKDLETVRRLWAAA